MANSDLPCLVGLTALRNNKAIVDFNTMKMYFPGPGQRNLESAMAPGTKEFQCELAPSGHMVMPCSEFQGRQAEVNNTLTLLRQDESGTEAEGDGRLRFQ